MLEDGRLALAQQFCLFRGHDIKLFTRLLEDIDSLGFENK